MQDACKAIIKTERHNVLLDDGECVLTNAYGKLRAKCVLHAVAPTWTKYVVNSPQQQTAGDDGSARFESLFEQTIVNAMRLAHHHKQQHRVHSMAWPVAAHASGGAFDIPVELYAHLLYTQLVNMPLLATAAVDLEDNNQPGIGDLTLRTICVTSMEAETVKSLCELFANYHECHVDSYWAIPLSPLSRLVQKVRDSLPPPPPPSSSLVPQMSQSAPAVSSGSLIANYQRPSVVTRSILRTTSESSAAVPTLPPAVSSGSSNATFAMPRPPAQLPQQQKPTPNVTILQRSQPLPLSAGNRSRQTPEKEDTNNQANNTTTSNNKQRTNSMNETTTPAAPTTIMAKPSMSITMTGITRTVVTSSSQPLRPPSLAADACCLFCQKEATPPPVEAENTTSNNSNNNNNNKVSLVSCGNTGVCRAAYCQLCIAKYLAKQTSRKCPGCQRDIEPSVVAALRLDMTRSSSSSSSTSLSPTRLKQANHRKAAVASAASANSTTVSSSAHPPSGWHHRLAHPHQITSGRIYVRKLDEPCAGYEDHKSLLITFEVNDGVQTVLACSPLFSFALSLSLFDRF